MGRCILLACLLFALDLYTLHTPFHTSFHSTACLCRENKPLALQALKLLWMVSAFSLPDRSSMLTANLASQVGISDVAHVVHAMAWMILCPQLGEQL